MEIVKIGKEAPVQSVVDGLEKLLGLAKSGRLRGVVGIGTILGADGANFSFGKIDTMATIGHLHVLSHTLVNTLSSVSPNKLDDEPSEK